MTPDTRVQWYVAVIGTVGVGISMLGGPSLGLALIVAALGGVALIEINREPAQQPSTPPSAPASEPDPFIPLPEAMSRLCTAVPPDQIDKWVRCMTDGTPEATLRWLADWSKDKGLSIYGKRPPSSAFEMISKERLKAAGYVGGAEALVRDGQKTYADLAVRRDEFEAMFERLKDFGLPLSS